MNACCGAPLSFTFSPKCLFTTSQSSPCREALKRNDTATCRVLPTLGAEFGWNFTNNKSQIDIYFTAKLDAEMGWVAWGLNPRERPQMVGTRALIGIRYPNGTLSIDKYNITADTKLGCHLQPSDIDVVVRKMRPEYSSETGYFTIYATLVLPMEYNMSKLHHVWQVGYNVEGVVPRKHPTTLQNVDSTDTINLWTRKSQSIGKHRHHLRMVHGILNIVGWGTLMPMGCDYRQVLQEIPNRIHMVVRSTRLLPNCWIHSGHNWLGHWPMARTRF
ncbi:hypothetical protein L1049_001052 [Liquidambar formosana]|uniref:DOMON domain-containing protein n=1 Tax=Liquidambar formosana TaxID=63359 RepID=A0AAP0N9W6_LIQFO